MKIEEYSANREKVIAKEENILLETPFNGQTVIFHARDTHSMLTGCSYPKDLPMDPIDRKILALLQTDASLSIAEIAQRVGLSQTPCWKRIQKMEAAGIIKGRVALLSGKKLDLGLTVFVQLRTKQHDEVWLNKFSKAVKEMPEVVEVYRMAGDIDYLLRVVVRDTDAYDRFYKTLIKKVPLHDVSSSFAMEEIKYTTALPIEESRAA